MTAIVILWESSSDEINSSDHPLNIFSLIEWLMGRDGQRNIIDKSITLFYF